MLECVPNKGHGRILPNPYPIPLPCANYTVSNDLAVDETLRPLTYLPTYLMEIDTMELSKSSTLDFTISKRQTVLCASSSADLTACFLRPRPSDSALRLGSSWGADTQWAGTGTFSRIHLRSGFTFAIASQSIGHAQVSSEPVTGVQGDKRRIPCHLWLCVAIGKNKLRLEFGHSIPNIACKEKFTTSHDRCTLHSSWAVPLDTVCHTCWGRWFSNGLARRTTLNFTLLIKGNMNYLQSTAIQESLNVASIFGIEVDIFHKIVCDDVINDFGQTKVRPLPFPKRKAHICDCKYSRVSSCAQYCEQFERGHDWQLTSITCRRRALRRRRMFAKRKAHICDCKYSRVSSCAQYCEQFERGHDWQLTSITCRRRALRRRRMFAKRKAHICDCKYSRVSSCAQYCEQFERGYDWQLTSITCRRRALRRRRMFAKRKAHICDCKYSRVSSCAQYCEQSERCYDWQLTSITCRRRALRRRRMFAKRKAHICDCKYSRVSSCAQYCEQFERGYDWQLTSITCRRRALRRRRMFAKRKAHICDCKYSRVSSCAQYCEQFERGYDWQLTSITCRRRALRRRRMFAKRKAHICDCKYSRVSSCAQYCEQFERGYDWQLTSITCRRRALRRRRMFAKHSCAPHMVIVFGRERGAAVAERLACSPPTKANRVQSPAGSLPDFRMWKSCQTTQLVSGFSRGSSVSRVLSSECCSILTSMTLIGSQDLAVTSCPNLITHSIKTMETKRSFQPCRQFSEKYRTGKIIMHFLNDTMQPGVQLHLLHTPASAEMIFSLCTPDSKTTLACCKMAYLSWKKSECRCRRQRQKSPRRRCLGERRCWRVCGRRDYRLSAQQNVLLPGGEARYRKVPFPSSTPSHLPRQLTPLPAYQVKPPPPLQLTETRNGRSAARSHEWPDDVTPPFTRITRLKRGECAAAPEKTRRPTASSATIPTCENKGNDPP
ncbi:hypothetical protein PR048_023897 [Dryococelus australis]|uniref:Uncharacterized protein n=1 Tax=Dryococelus australis TaxID=614101 RepID=A0ABQ9GVC2_9NEOP|nr:hypothetical protein PR048_023897 [Dryococelus australis]